MSVENFCEQLQVSECKEKEKIRMKEIGENLVTSFIFSVAKKMESSWTKEEDNLTCESAPVETINHISNT